MSPLSFGKGLFAASRFFARGIVPGVVIVGVAYWMVKKGLENAEKDVKDQKAEKTA